MTEHRHLFQLLQRTTILCGIAACVAAAPALAAPQGGMVTGGAASISQTGKVTDIHQTSDRAVIQWSGFDIAGDETAQFHQPSANAIALNRIRDNKPSQIDGKLKANGNLILINPNGVVFGAGAQVDVNGLVATTSDIDDDNEFLTKQRLNFTRPGNADARITNSGTITAKEAGLVGLVAPQVVNNGVIAAKLGKVHLASGDAFTLDLAGDGLTHVAVTGNIQHQLVENNGLIEAQGGYVQLTAANARDAVDSLIMNRGTIAADSYQQRKGEIVLYAEGDKTAIVNTGALRARGLNAGENGGKVRLHAANIEQSGTVDVSAAHGAGGSVQMEADTLLHNGLTAATGETAGGWMYLQFNDRYIASTGSIVSVASSLGKGGNIVVEGGDNANLYSAGAYIADGATTGGNIDLLAGNNIMLLGALLFNSGNNGGGLIRIGGDYLGTGTTRRARNTYVDENTFVFADARTSGNGGRVIVWSDGNTAFYGNIYGRGGTVSGDGGFVETSGHGHLDAGGYVDLTAQNATGKKGLYFLDPTNITIYGNVDPTFVSTDGTINLTTNLRLWLDASDTSKVNLTYNSMSTTVTGSPAANQITVGSATGLVVGARIRLNGAGSVTAASTLGNDTYTITAIAGTTITLDSNLTGSYTGNTVYQGYVSQLTDKSSNAFNATQGTASSMALWVSNGQNGIGVARFDGVNDLLVTSDPYSNNNDVTAFLVGTSKLTRGGNIGGFWSIQLGYDTANQSIVLMTSGAAQYNAPAPAVPGLINVLLLDQGNPTGGQSTYQTISSGSAGAISTLNNTTLRTSSEGIKLGISDATYVAGDIDETIMYSSVLSANAIVLLNQYQSAKWGAALTNPGSGATEAAKAMASIQKGDAVDGYSVFTTRYLERLSATADISLQASNDITLDLKTDTLALASGRSITLTAGNDILSASAGTIQTAGAGNITLAATRDITFAHDLDLNATGSGAVTLRAGRNITYSASGDITTAGGAITLNSDRDGDSAGAINLGSATVLTSGGGAIDLVGGTTAAGYAFGTGPGTYKNGISLSGATLTAGGGNITLSGKMKQSAVDYGGGWGLQSGVDIGGASVVQTTGSGTITMTGVSGLSTRVGGDDGSVGVSVYGTSLISVENGTLAINGSTYLGNTINGQEGIYNGATSIIRSTGTGAINMSGTSNSTTSAFNIGVDFFGTVQTVNGDVTITGIANNIATTSGNTRGVQFQGSAAITSTGVTAGQGRITVNATAGTGTTTDSTAIWSSAPFAISSVAGDITITGTAGTAGTVSYGWQHATNAASITSTGAANIAITLTGNTTDFYSTTGITFGNSVAANYTGNITVNANTLSLTSPVFKTTGNVTFAQRTAATTVGINGAAGTLQITSGLLATITANTLTIGRNDNSQLMRFAALDLSARNYNLALVSGGGIIRFDGGTITMATDKYLTATSASGSITSNAAGSIITSGTGYITLDAGSSITFGHDFDLTTSTGAVTLYADDNITYSASGDITTGSGATVGGAITLNTRSGNAATGYIALGNGTVIASNGGNIRLVGGSTGTGYAIGNSSSGKQAGIAFSGTVILNAEGAASGGAITLLGQGGTYASGANNGMDLTGTIKTNFAGTLTITGVGGTGGNGNYGVSGGGTIQTQNGLLSITGTGGGNAATTTNYGIYTGATITATGSGNVSLFGYGGNTTATSNYGVYINNGTLSTNSGILTLDGTGIGGSGAPGYDVYVTNSAASNGGLATTSGSIALIGRATGDNAGIYIAASGTLDYASVSTWTLTTASNISIVAAVTKSTGADSTWTLTAPGNIIISNTIQSTSNKLNFVLNSNSDASGTGYILLSSAGQLISNGGNITLGGDAGASGYAVGSTANNQQWGVALNGGTSKIDAQGGHIVIKGKGGAYASGTNYGVYVNVGTVTTSGTGTIDITGEGGTSSNSNFGVYMLSSAGITSTGSGTISITGIGGSGTTNYGIRGLTGTNSIGGASATGNITLTTTTGDILLNNTNIRTNSSGTVLVSSAGALTLTGAYSILSTAGTVDVRAASNIILSSSFDITTGNGGGTGGAITLNADRDGNSNGAISLDTGTVLTSNGGNISLVGGTTGSGYAYGNSGIVNSATGYSGIYLNGAQLQAGGGDITLRGYGDATHAGGYDHGIFLNASSQAVTTGSGNITMTGFGGGTVGSANNNYGITFYQSNTVSTATGTLSITGTGGSGVAGNYGVVIQNANTVKTTSGALNVTGTLGAINGGGTDLYLDSTFGAGAGAETGNMTFTGDTVSGSTYSFQTTGNVTFKVRTSGTTVRLGDAGTGTLQLTNSLFTGINAGTITIGDRTNTGDMVINTNHSFAEAITLLTKSGANVTLSSQLTSTAAGNAIVVVSGNNFTNSVGASGFNPTNGRKLLYINSAGTNSLNSMTFTDTYVNKTYESDPPSGYSADSLFYSGYIGTITVTADAQAITYGAVIPTLTYVCAGGGCGTITGALTSGGGNAGATPNANTYSITQGALTSSTYAITYNSANLVVSPKSLSVTATAGSKNYGAADGALAYTYSGLTNGDLTASFTGALTRAAGETVAGGPYAITIGTLAATGNYTISSYTGANFTIIPATLTITASNRAKTYGDTVVFAGTEFTTSALQNGETVGSVTLSSAGTASSATVAGGPYSITASAATGGTFTAGNYNISYAAGSLTVNKATLNIDADDVSRAYGAANSLTGTTTGFVNGENLASSGVTGAAAISTAANASSAVGTYAIAAALGTLAASNYDFSFSGGTLTVTKAQLTVTADAKSKTYGSANPGLTSTITGFANSETLGTSGVSGSAALSTAAGAASVVGTYNIATAIGTLAASNYDFTLVDGTLTVDKAHLTVTAADKSKTYGDANPALTGAITGFVNGEVLGTSGVTGGAAYATGATSASNAGTYAITSAVGTLAASNYDFTYVNGTLTVGKATLTVTADNKNRAYGSANPAFTSTITGFVNSEVLGTSGVTGSAALATGATTASNVGAYAITAGAGTLASGNYNFTYANGTLTIDKAMLTVTADDKNRAYGSANPALSSTITGFANGEVLGTSGVTGSAALATGATTASNVGTYAITSGAGTLAASNYDFSYVNGTLTVNKALLTVTGGSATRDYGAANPTLTSGITGFVNGEVLGTSGVTGAASVSTAATSASNAGAYAVATGAGSLSASNYDFTYVNGTLTIAPKALTVAADNGTREYGLSNPSFSYSVSGLVNGDTASLVSGVSLTTAATSASNAGAYAINASGGSVSGGNYTINTYTGGLLTVTKATLTLAADDKSRYYGDANPTLTYSVLGLRNGDAAGSILTGTGVTTAAGLASNVGAYALTMGGSLANATNYNLTLQNGTLTVNAAPLSVTAQDKTKTQGEANPAFTLSFSGLKAGDDASVFSGYTLYTLAGTNSAQGIYAINLSGGTASNYSVTRYGGILTIEALLGAAPTPTPPVTLPQSIMQTPVYTPPVAPMISAPAPIAVVSYSPVIAANDTAPASHPDSANDNNNAHPRQTATVTIGGGGGISYSSNCATEADGSTKCKGAETSRGKLTAHGNDAAR